MKHFASIGFREKKVIPSTRVVNENNKGAIDWNHGVIAFGSQTNVVIVDDKTCTVINVLSQHTEDVTALRIQSNFLSEIPYNKKNCYLVSGDKSGNILLWDNY